MTSRERIIETINHREPDLLAIDFGAMRSTGISINAYDKLRRHLGITKGFPKLYDIFQQLAEPEQAVLDRLGGDVVQAHRLAPAFGFTIEQWKEEKLGSGVTALVPSEYTYVKREDGSQEIVQNGIVTARMPSDGLYYDVVDFPMKDLETQDDIDKIEFPRISDKELDFIEAECKTLYETTDRAILVCFGGNILEAGESYMGFQHFFEQLLIEPELMHSWMSKLTDAYMYDLERLLPRIAPYAQVIQFGDDLGMQNAPLISPETYREMIKPYHARMYRYVQNNFPSLKVFLHSCGAISTLIPDLIDAGVQILNPVQISSEGMDPKWLKKEFGKSLTFWGGGANMQHTVLHEGLDAIRKETRELIEIFAPGGGYVFNQVHNIQANVPPEKVMAIYDTALAYRKEQMEGRI